MPFSVGDLVHLKSGGPRMTVTEVRESTIRNPPITQCLCAWFPATPNGWDTMENVTLPIDALEPWEKTPDKPD